MPLRFDKREALAQYYACVTQIDEQVGRVLDELDALKQRDNTFFAKKVIPKNFNQGAIH